MYMCVCRAMCCHDVHVCVQGYCYQRALDLGVAHAQLPISQYVKLNCRTVLAVNHGELFCGTIKIMEVQLLGATQGRKWESSCK